MVNNKFKLLTVGQLLGILLIAGALYKFVGLLDYQYYQFMFQHLPEEVIAIRYCLSISLRCVGFLAGVGLILKLEVYRRLAIGLAVLNLLTLYWKHPYEVFYHIAFYSELNFPYPFPVINPGEELMYPFFPVISLIFHSTIDVIFSGVLMYLLTRPDIKAQFTNPK